MMRPLGFMNRVYSVAREILKPNLEKLNMGRPRLTKKKQCREFGTGLNLCYLKSRSANIK